MIEIGGGIEIGGSIIIGDVPVVFAFLISDSGDQLITEDNIDFVTEG